jgi:6-phosphogluconolactonase (cycloisomerase 2 family)
MYTMTTSLDSQARRLHSHAFPATASDVSAMVYQDKLYCTFAAAGQDNGTRVVSLVFDNMGSLVGQEVQALQSARTLTSFQALGQRFLLASRDTDSVLMRFNGSMFVDSVQVSTNALDASSGQVISSITASAAHFYAHGNHYLIGSSTQSTGILLFGRVENVTGLRGPQSIQVSPSDGRFVLVASLFSKDIEVYHRDSVSGLLLFLSRTEVEGGVEALAMSPDQRFVYVTSLLPGAVSVYRLHQVTGGLLLIQV